MFTAQLFENHLGRFFRSILMCPSVPVQNWRLTVGVRAEGRMVASVKRRQRGSGVKPSKKQTFPAFNYFQQLQIGAANKANPFYLTSCIFYGTSENSEWLIVRYYILKRVLSLLLNISYQCHFLNRNHRQKLIQETWK